MNASHFLIKVKASMSNKNASLKSGIRDNLLRETVHDFLQQEIKNGPMLTPPQP